MNTIKEDGSNSMTPREMAELIYDALYRATLLDLSQQKRAVDIIEEELSARRGVGDYREPQDCKHAVATAVVRCG